MATDLDAASRRTLKKKLWDPLGIVPPGGALWKAAVGISPKWWQWKKKMVAVDKKSGCSRVLLWGTPWTYGQKWWQWSRKSGEGFTRITKTQ
jgi:hypothetical protein